MIAFQPLIEQPGRRRLFLFALVLVAGITFSHYMTPTRLHPVHELLKVLYFVPILMFAYGYGFWGGLLSGLAVTFLYLPHIMFQWGGATLMNLSRFLMIGLYLLIGTLTGFLWQRERRERQEVLSASNKLQQSYEQLQNASEELTRVESQLLFAERLATLGELTAALAHEVRNPLGSIQGVAEILRDESKDPSLQKFVDILIKETQRLDSVVENYLSLSHRQASPPKVRSFKSLIEPVVTLLGPELRKKSLQVESDYQPKSVSIQCREGEMQQAFLNLLLNAIQASPENGTISIVVRSNEHRVICSISDEGRGVDEEIKSRVFEPFFTTKEQGTGLGLAITRRIVERNQGSISIENREPQGTRVNLEFEHEE
jgi:signal transduction histidine kinase